MKIRPSYRIAIFWTAAFLSLNLQAQSVAVRHDYVQFNEYAYEIPALKKTDIVIVYEGFTLSYNSKTLIPNWVAYELTSS